MSSEQERPFSEAKPLFSPLAHAYVERSKKEDQIKKTQFESLIGDRAMKTTDSTVQQGLDNIINLINAQRYIDGLPKLEFEEKMEIMDAFNITNIVKLNAAESGMTEVEARFKFDFIMVNRKKAASVFEDRGPKYIANALRIADELGVKPEQVFQDESLYKELVRCTITPNEAINEILDVASVLLNRQSYIESAKAYFIESYPLLKELPELERDNILDDLFSTPEFSSELEKQMQVFRNAIKGVLISEVGRFWGPDVAAQSIASVYLNEGNAETSRRSGVLEKILNERGLSLSDLKKIGNSLTISEMEEISQEVDRRLNQD